MGGRISAHRKRECWIQVSLPDQKAAWDLDRPLLISSSPFELRNRFQL